MKLVFFGDSFTYGYNIDIEYGLEKKILPKEINFFNRNNLNQDVFKIINDFRINNNWPALLSKELKLEHENLSTPGCGFEMIYCKFLQYEKNKKEESFYIFGLPITFIGRKLVTKENINSYNSLENFFETYHYQENNPDFIFFKKYYNENYFVFSYINIISSISNYCKNKNISFLFLPTWTSNIKNHFNLIKNEILKDYIQHFIFNEINDQLNLSIDLKKIKKLSCFHPNSESQHVIKDMYLNHVNNYIEK